METLFQQEKNKYREGDLYKVLNVHGAAFPLYYGYYEEFERHSPSAEPIPIYPDFLQHPKYTSHGHPFVTKMQDACVHYKGNAFDSNECGECVHFEPGEELLGVCICPKNKEVL